MVLVVFICLFKLAIEASHFVGILDTIEFN
nr:MAG TPA: hypothetical protein [Bacteriophage sp.]DAT46397.1 MAG TPA: hypothetical protein [Caudoviricetes sp.]DAU59211.1 MAG TPA: hypothetical protein [Crassvirales sp.]